MAPTLAMGHMRGRDRWSPSDMRMHPTAAGTDGVPPRVKRIVRPSHAALLTGRGR